MTNNMVISMMLMLMMLFNFGCAARRCTVAGNHTNYDDTSYTGLKFNKPFNAIVLSGGGSYGAWGAGVIEGWGSSYRPEFDVVAGLSTGALQGTFVLLGDDQGLRRAYTEIDDSDVFTDRHLLAIPFSDSLRDTGPLQVTISRLCPNEVIDKVGKEYDRGRRLFVATVNIDTGLLNVWDMTAIAAGDDPGRYDLYRRVLLASSAIPVLFPPVEIDGSLHIDGGLRQPMFFVEIITNIMESWGRANSQTKSLRPPNIYVLINNGVSMGRRCVRNELMSLAFRSVSIIEHETVAGSLYHMHAKSKEYNIGMKFGWIPVISYPDFGPDRFDKIGMGDLYSSGIAWGKAGIWYDEMPSFAVIRKGRQ